MSPQSLDPRLQSAIPFIPVGARCIDVGTDHAYLPIYLAEHGISACLLASDINQGPIDAAKEHIRAAGLSHLIETRRTDGLQGLADFRPDCILIFGMGGELIMKILADAPWTKNERITLVLQPMSRASLLRRFLLEQGYTIVGESLSKSGRLYQTIAARYTGHTEVYTEEELLLGRENLLHPSPLLRAFVTHEKQVLEKVKAGKERSEEASLAYETEMIEILTKRLETLP